MDLHKSENLVALLSKRMYKSKTMAGVMLSSKTERWQTFCALIRDIKNTKALNVAEVLCCDAEVSVTYLCVGAYRVWQYDVKQGDSTTYHLIKHNYCSN